MDKRRKTFSSGLGWIIGTAFTAALTFAHTASATGGEHDQHWEGCGHKIDVTIVKEGNIDGDFLFALTPSIPPWEMFNLDPTTDDAADATRTFTYLPILPFYVGEMKESLVDITISSAGTIYEVGLDDVFGFGYKGILAGCLDDCTVTFTNTAVPLPAAAWLFGSGLLGLAGVARKRRQA